MRLFFATLAVVLFAPAAAQQFYVCNGGKSFSSVPMGDDCVLQKTYEQPRNGARPAAAPAPAPAPGKKPPPIVSPVPRQQLPVVSAATQKSRDVRREEILREELRIESAFFNRLGADLEAEKAKALPDAQTIAGLLEHRRIRAQNIIAIKQELARLQP